MMLRLSFVVAGAIALAGCAKSATMPANGGETNWLQTCDGDTACDQGSCICGVCTLGCNEASACDGDFSGRCVEIASNLTCPGHVVPSGSVCLPSCEDSACGEGFRCRNDVCVVEPETGDGDGDGDRPIPDDGVEQDGVVFTVEMEQDAVTVVTSPAGVIFPRTCSGDRIERNVGGSSMPLRDDRPASSDSPGYFLDGLYFGPSFNLGCDEIDCYEDTDGRHPIALALEYEKVGTARAPVGADNAGEIVDRIESRAVSGDLYVYFHYAPDAGTCDDTEVRLDVHIPAAGVCCPMTDEGCSIDGPQGGWARNEDECAPLPLGPAFDAAYVERQDAHDCPALVYRDDICCGCYNAENALEDCAAEKPCLGGRALLIDGAQDVAPEAVICILEALAAGAPGLYEHFTSSTVGQDTVAVRHTILIEADGAITYARVPSSTSKGVETIEIHEPALGCEPEAASYFSDCVAAITTDMSSEEAFRCAFGDGTESSPSQLGWLTDCAPVEPTCD